MTLNRILILPLLLASLALSGCASMGGFLDPNGRSILSGGISATASIHNPVGPNELAAIEVAYRTALIAGVNYRRYCYSDAIANLPPVCSKRKSVVQALQQANYKVRLALTALRSFVRNNDTVSAWSAIASAKKAIFDLQAVAAANGVT